MSVKIVLDNIIPATVPTNGWRVSYRILGTTGSYTVVGPFFTLPIEITTADPDGTLYEGYIQRDCGTSQSTLFFFQTPCDCLQAGYVTGPSGIVCEKYLTEAPTITNSDYCLAASRFHSYSNNGSRIYTFGFVPANLVLPIGSTGSHIYSDILTPTQWKNDIEANSSGPMNRAGVWIDSDCNGVKDSLAADVQTTIACIYNNTTGVDKTIYIGAGGDNRFQIKVNGTSIIDTGISYNTLTFQIWHILPVIMEPGINYINMVGTGSGTVNDAMGMVLYDNTAAEILAATSDSQLNIPFKSSSLRGTSYEVATCADGYSLDVSGGVGSYICRKTLFTPCNTE